MDVIQTRIDKGMSQKRLAMEAGVHPKTVRRIERGEPVQPENLRQVHKALGIRDHVPAESGACYGFASAADPGWSDWRIAWSRIEASDRVKALVEADRAKRHGDIALFSIWIGTFPIAISLVAFQSPGWLFGIWLVASIAAFMWSVVWSKTSSRRRSLAESIVPKGERMGAMTMIEAVRRGELLLTPEQRRLVLLLASQGDMEIARAELEARTPDPVLDVIRIPGDQGVGEAASIRA